jgi:hypothetical protein
MTTAWARRAVARKTAAASGEYPIVAEAVLENYPELTRTVTRLRGLCVTLRDHPEPADPALSALIEEFASQVSRHFAAEEREGGLVGGGARGQPHLVQRIDRLQHEHWEMAQALDRLLEFARSEPPAPELAQRVGTFLDWFDAHEHAENALMQDFLLVDEGGGGQ